MGDENIEKIIPLLEEENYPKDSYIIYEGAAGDSMYIILSGSVGVLKSVNHSKKIIINHLHPESHFGELALIDNLPRSASIIADQDTRILRLRKTTFDILLQENPDIARIFYRNCLKDTIYRYREMTSEFSYSKFDLEEKNHALAEISKDLSSAKKLQDFFINSKTLNYRAFKIKGLRQSFIYEPCQEIGGDFLNLVQVGPKKYGVVIADVMGHGITAALATGAFKSAFSLMVKDLAENPSLLLASLNNHFFKAISSLFASCFFAFLDLENKEITMARAGHYYPAFYKSKDSSLVEINLKGPALGLKKHAQYEQTSYRIESGDRLMFFTDGIIEQKNPAGDMYSEEKLKETFLQLAKRDFENILETIYDDFRIFKGEAKIDDDITLLLLEFRKLHKV